MRTSGGVPTNTAEEEESTYAPERKVGVVVGGSVHPPTAGEGGAEEKLEKMCRKSLALRHYWWCAESWVRLPKDVPETAFESRKFVVEGQSLETAGLDFDHD